MKELLNGIKATAQQAGQSTATTRQGIVTGYDPSAYAVKVTLQPDGTLTGWIPLKSAWVGNGWGMFCPPSLGDAVEVDFQEADGGVGSAGLRFYNDVDKPLSCPSGELWLVHKSGSFIKLLNSGAISSSGQWNHAGNITVTGGNVLADGKSLKTHTHGGVMVGGGSTGATQ